MDIYVSHQVTSNLIFFGAFTALLQYFGVLHLIVGTVGTFLSFIVGVSAAESFQAAANIFLGPVSIVVVCDVDVVVCYYFCKQYKSFAD